MQFLNQQRHYQKNQRHGQIFRKSENFSFYERYDAITKCGNVTNAKTSKTDQHNRRRYTEIIAGLNQVKIHEIHYKTE